MSSGGRAADLRLRRRLNRCRWPRAYLPAGGDVREHPAPEVLPRAPTNFAEVVGARLRRDADENARLRHQLRCLRNGEDGGEDLGEDGGEGVLGGVASLGVCLGMKRPSAASTTP